MAVSCISAGFAVTVVLLVVVPRVEEVFRDFGTKLPTGTILLLKFSRFCRAGGILSVWGVFAMLPFVPPLFDKPATEAPRRRFFNPPRLLLTLFLLLFFGWMIFALFTPYVALINSVSGSAGKR
jgi:type II secretory pathway component PulF